MLPNWLYGKSKSKLAELLGGGGTPSDYNQVKAQVTQNTEDIARLDDTLDGKAALTQISNPNLLDNPWFTVNQRGSSSYTANGYCVDRWTIAGTSADKEVKIVSAGLELKQNTSTSDAWVATSQYIAHDDLIIGKKYTISILYADGTIKNAVSSPLAESDSYTRFAFTDVYQDVNINFDYQGAGGYFLLGVQTKNSTVVDTTIRAVKLELGSVSTLAMDAAPNYTTELLKCQRYFHKYATETLRPSNMYDCVPEMRATPTQSTITIDSTTYYTNSADF